MSKDENGLTAGERGDEGIVYDAARAVANEGGPGLLIEGFYPGNIVELGDGTWMTDRGQRSADRGRTWSGPDPRWEGVYVQGLVRMPNGELGMYYADRCTMAVALGNESNNWFFRWSADEGATWGAPVKMTVDGVTMGLAGTMFALRDGRLVVVTYSQFITRDTLWGGSYGTYRGHRIKTESEGHFGEFEVVRVYTSDDHGRSWKPNDGWLMGWREGAEKWTDSFVEATGVELSDGRLLLLGRSLVGRIYECFSDDRGETWGYATPTGLMSSDSPGRLARLASGELVFVWSQISRDENRRGFRRSRLSSAISTDEGKTWTNFKNLASIECLADRSFIPPDPDMTPIWGDDDVGELPEDYEMWHYPTMTVMGEEVFLGMCHNVIGLGTDDEGNEVAQYDADVRTWVVPGDWFRA